MRIRRVLLIVSLTFLGGATPPFESPTSPARCLSSPAPQRMAEYTNEYTRPILPRPKPLPKYDAEARDYLIRTLVFEAADEPDEGKAAVVHVILNRLRSERWGNSVKTVVTQPWQFEPWMTRRNEIRRLSIDDPRYLDAARVTDSVLAGVVPDPTDGATHFLNPDIVRKRRGGSLPAWARGEGQSIGRHTFYAPYEGNALPQQAVLYLGGTIGSRSSCS